VSSATLLGLTLDNVGYLGASSYNKGMIKAVLFDYGGVLTESGKVGNIQKVLGHIYGIDPAQIKMGDQHRKFIRGLIGEPEFFGALNRQYGKQVSADHEIFAAESSGFFKRSEPVYDLAARLRKAGLVTGIFSNIYPMSARELKKRGFYKGFDPVILSCEEHAAKPEAAFFEAALAKLNLPGKQVLFIDDQTRFQAAAESFGMHFITAVSPQQIVHDVRQLILQENNLRLD
jgi:epoxide hydrolase-like predicted phosphatase